MSGFWTSPTGNIITGSAESAFLPDFTIIPDGTYAMALIKKFETINKPMSQYSDAQKFIQITYKLADGDFKGREVIQKIKVFDGKPEQIERALNMLKLIMDLCGFKPDHNNEPTPAELSTMQGKVLGIKIREWSVPKQDGTGYIDGNYVSEVYDTKGFKSETGIKLEVKHELPDTSTAFSRNPRGQNLNNSETQDDIPF